MARIEDHLEVDRDLASGKAPAMLRTPWNDSPDQGTGALRDKARRVLSGEHRFSSEERDQALARLILGG